MNLPNDGSPILVVANNEFNARDWFRKKFPRADKHYFRYITEERQLMGLRNIRMYVLSSAHMRRNFTALIRRAQERQLIIEYVSEP